MTLSLKTDRSRAGGGFALLEGDGLADVSTIAIENAAAPGSYLGEDGRWGKAPFQFPVETAGGALSLGPHVVDFVPTDMQVALHAQDGRDLGKLFWADVIPSRNPRSVTSSQVFDDRRRKAEEAVRLAATEAAAEAKAHAESEAAAQRQTDEAAQAETKRRQAEARRQQEDLAREQVARAELDRQTVTIDPGPPKTRRTGLYALLALVLVAAAIGGVLAVNPKLLDRFRTADVTPAPAPSPPPTPPPAPAPTPAPVATPPAPTPVDCGHDFADRLDGLARLSDPQKVELGEAALHAGCGGEAFRAFDAADLQSNEAAAWHLARFYDPNETDPVYRHAARAHADFAAAYYRIWRDRSPRQAAALAAICRSDHDAGASLRRSCGR